MCFNSRTVGHQIFAGHNDRFRAGQPLGHLNELFVSNAQDNRDLTSFAVSHSVHVLIGLQPGYRVDRNLKGVMMHPYYQFHAGEHPGFECVFRIAEVHFHRHGPGGSIQCLDDASQRPLKGPPRIGIGVQFSPLADLHQWDVLFHNVQEHSHRLNIMEDKNASGHRGGASA